MEIRPRATGKTFRSILQALSAASEGKNVVFLVNDRGQCSSAFQNAVRMGGHRLRANFSQKILEFPNGGKLYFTWDLERLKGQTVNVIVDDVGVPCYEEDIEEMEILCPGALVLRDNGERMMVRDQDKKQREPVNVVNIYL